MPDIHGVFDLDQIPMRSVVIPGICYADDPESIGALADRIGHLKAIRAEIDAELDHLTDLLRKSGQTEAEGDLFRVAIGAESVKTRLDRKGIEKEMGEAWTARFLKFSKCAGSLLCTARHGKVRRAAA